MDNTLCYVPPNPDNSHMTEMMSVTTILQTVTGSCDFYGVRGYEGDTMDEKRTNFWIDVIQTKSNDSGFADLIDSILQHGFDPVSCVGWDEDNCYITEGHHRLTAAILLGLDEVPVCPSGSRDDRGVNSHGKYCDSHSEYQCEEPECYNGVGVKF